MIALAVPSLDLLPDYVAALERGWSPDNIRLEAAAREHLQRIDADAAGFLASLDDPEGRGAPIVLPDGNIVPRLPGFTRWIVDGAFCGSIGFRWQPGGSSLPEHVLGHIGFAVVPWKRGQGCATAALRLMLPEAKACGLDYVELTTLQENIASQRVILANGGRYVKTFDKLPHYGGGETLLFRIDL
jgi:predicted acetyltransferase